MDNVEKNSILIVDDEKMDLEILNNILSRNYTIYMTKNGSTAIELANKYVPDLILLDIVMPGMNGYEVLTKLKESPKTQNIPAIFITGLDSVEDEEKGLGLDAADFIHKPFSSTIVRLRVRNQIQIVNQIKKIRNYAHEMAAAEERSKFFARMSHEMRTPLNAVIGLSEMTLEEGGMSVEARENVEKINSSGSSLLALVNDILDISKIESGKFQIVPVEFNISDMISDAVIQNTMHKEDKPIEFVLNIDENLPVRLFGDDQRIKQILNNLLSNAFKYTTEGTIELILRCQPSKNDSVFLIMTVRDTGIGIKDEDIGNLFSDYIQMDVEANRRVEGTGLGLSITKMITEMMGGTISVESIYNKGSAFTVSIPIKLIGSDVIGPGIAGILQNLKYHTVNYNKKLISRNSLPYAHILIVDDTLTNIDVAKGMMKPYRMKIDTLTSGIAAVDSVREEKIRYNAIFMDHMMPIMDGVEAVRIIREEIGTEYAKTVPIIALTANAFSGNEEMFLSKGFQAFIPKPIDIIRLDNVINKWIRNKEKEKLYKDQQITIDGQTFFDSRTGKDRRSGTKERRKGIDRRIREKFKDIDISKGLERFRGDIDTYLHILKSFTVNTKLDLKAMKEVNKDYLPQYAIIVHGVKSSCRGICAEIMGNRAEELEEAAKAGDLAAVKANNASFIEDLLKVIANIEESLLGGEIEKTEKPKKEKPYSEALDKLKIACDNFQIKEIDNIMEEIECFEYTADGGLACWLRINIDQMNFTEISEKLSGLS